MVTSSSKHQVIYEGKHTDSDSASFSHTKSLHYLLADDDPLKGERSGWGMPVSFALKKKMIGDYKAEMDELHRILEKLPDIVEGTDIRGIKNSFSEENEIVGGIYGKETLLTLLAQPGCEGVLYINCIYNGGKSIVLQGIDKDGNPIAGGTANNGRVLSGRDFVNQRLIDVETDKTPILGDELAFEVKGGSITRSEVKNLSIIDSVDNYIMGFFSSNENL